MMANAKKQPPASLPSRPMENVHLPTPGSFGAGLAGMAGLAGLQGLAGLGAAAFGANPLIPQFPMAGLYGFGGNFQTSIPSRQPPLFLGYSILLCNLSRT